MQNILEGLKSFHLKHIRTKIIVLFFFIAIISSIISIYSIYKLETLEKNVDEMESDLGEIQSGITTISTIGLNISDVHAKIGVLINQMHHCFHLYDAGNEQARDLFFKYQENFTSLINRLDDEIGNQYGFLQVDIAHIQSNFNQYVYTVENPNGAGIFDHLETVNHLENQLEQQLDQISISNLTLITSLHNQINEEQQEINTIFKTLTTYESKIETQLDSLIENLYFEIDKINMNAQQSNQNALLTQKSIESEISVYKMQLIGSSIFLIICAGIIGYYYSTKITNALLNLTRASEKMQKGIFPEKPIEVDSNDEFRLLTDTFNSMMINIKQLLKQKNEFINQLGHDLKNPLGPLIHLMPIIEKHTTDPKDKEILNVIQRNVKYMKNLVEKTLELARLNAANTTLALEKIDLKEKVEEIIQRNKYMFKQKQITVENFIPDHSFISADHLRLEELLNNLLNNSVKYNSEQGSITINAEEQNDELLISVHDNGVGMTSEQLHHIFDEFYKADQSRHDFDSSGLGMPICKSIVEKHGGRIWAESEGINKGSTFYFTLPKKLDEEPRQPGLPQDFNHHDSSTSISERVDQLLIQKE